MTRKYFYSALTLGLLLCATLWTFQIEHAVAPSKWLTEASNQASVPAGATAATPSNRAVVYRYNHEQGVSVAPAPSIAVASNDDAPSSSVTPSNSIERELVVMSDQATFDALIEAQNADFREAVFAAFRRLGDDDFTRLIFERMPEITRRAAAGESNAQRLEFIALEMCSRARANTNFPTPCPVYAQPEQVYEQAFWRALTQGVPEAYPMGDVFLELKPNRDDYYSSAREILFRERQIYLQQVETGSCMALDWLANSYGFGARSDSALADPLLAYRYGYAMSQLGYSNYVPRNNRIEATLKPEITAYERVEAVKLLEHVFRNRPEHPSCTEYQKN